MKRLTGHGLWGFVAAILLTTAILPSVNAPAASAAGASYAGGAVGANVKLASIRVLLAVPMSKRGGSYVVRNSRIPMTIVVPPNDFGPPYKLVVALSIPQLVPLKGKTTLSAFFIGVFLGARSIVKPFPIPITVIIRSNRITIHDGVYRSVGRKWVIYSGRAIQSSTAAANVRTSHVVSKTPPKTTGNQIRPHVAILKIRLSDFYQLVAPRPVTHPQYLLCTIPFNFNSSKISPASKAAAIIAKCSKLIARGHFAIITITGRTNYLGSVDYNKTLGLGRAFSTQIAIERQLARLHAPPVKFIARHATTSAHVRTLSANRTATVTGDRPPPTKPKRKVVIKTKTK